MTEEQGSTRAGDRTVGAKHVSFLPGTDARPATSVRWGLVALVTAWTITALVSAFTVLRFSSVGPAAGGSLGLDFEAFRAAGQLVLDGHIDLLYEPDSDVYSSLADVGFVYPPWVAVLMIPWALLPFGLGLVLWTILGIGALVFTLRSAQVFDLRILIGALVSLPGSIALALGQSSFFLIALLALALAPVARDRSPRGWLIGIASWKPHVLGGFGLLAIGEPRRWLRSLLIAIGTAGALLVASAVFFRGSVAAWIGFIVGGVEVLASAILESSVPGGLALAAGMTGSWRLIISAVFGVCALTGVAILLRRTTAGLWEQIALATAAWLLFVPHVVVYDLLFLTIPLGGLIETAHRRDVVVAGTWLAFTSTLGPWLTILQLRTFDRALDLTTLGLIAFVVVAALWVARGRPILKDRLRADAIEISDRADTTPRSADARSPSHGGRPRGRG